jgi:hypothetical protein
MFDGARNWATQGVINYFEIFFRRDSGFVQHFASADRENAAAELFVRKQEGPWYLHD